MIPREILGPQERYERTGAQALRDIRPITVRLAGLLMSSFSGLVLAASAGVMMLAPATVNLIVPLSLAYAGWVLTRRVRLPMRLPASARMPDWNHPDPATRKPRLACGTIYLGRDWASGRELWLSAEDGRQHGTIPGTTGAGKTTAILSFLANALAQGSGFVLVDGKADNRLFGEVLALARRFGREDDVLVLNFMVASGARDSNSFNPFAIGNADAIRELLASQLGEQRPEDANGVFRSRAIALVGTMAPVLTWMRDHKNVPITIEKIRFALELRGIWKLATRRVFESRNPETGRIDEIPVPDMPEDLIYPLQAYLGEIPGYDTSLDYNKQKTDEPFKQHGFALFYFTATFTQLAVSLGHIFKVEQGDVEMRDVVLNRRILVVNLPALENSDDTLAALGKIVVASLRGMMAQILGARLEGDYAEIVANKPGMGVAPFQVVLDELAYYATSGLDRMLAMGRGLNIMFWLGFQEVSGIWARLGEKTQSLLGNANLTVAMRQQDAERTRRWIEQTAGQTYITQATSYQGGATGEYREAQHAEIRQVSRIDWNDLQRLIEGEAIILFGGRRIYAKLFHAAIKVSGPMRLNRPLRLPPPGPEIVETVRRRREIAARIERHLLTGHAADDPSATLVAMVRAMEEAAEAGKPAADCIGAALAAASEVPFLGQSLELGLRTGSVNTPFTPMLEDGLEPRGGGGGSGTSPDPVDAGLFDARMTIELSQRLARPVARSRALAALAAHDAARAVRSLPTPPPMLPEELCHRIEQIVDLVLAPERLCQETSQSDVEASH
jgi:intracellular multiplication protein IcmO